MSAKTEQDIVNINGTVYKCLVAPADVEIYGDEFTISFGWEPDRPCPCNCPNNIPHYIPGAARIAHSVQEAIDAGWLAKA